MLCGRYVFTALSLYQLFLATLLAGLSNAPWYNHCAIAPWYNSLHYNSLDFSVRACKRLSISAKPCMNFLSWDARPRILQTLGDRFTFCSLYRNAFVQQWQPTGYTRVLSHLFSLCQQPVFVSLLRQSESHLGLCFTGLASPVVMWCFITSVLPISWPPRLRTLLNTSWLEQLTRFVHCLYFL